jgi:hypothetical protein
MRKGKGQIYDRFIHKEIRGTKTEGETGRTDADKVLAASV